MASKFLLVGVFVLNLIAFSLAVAAEHRRSTATVRRTDNLQVCHYTSKVSSGLGLSSFVFLLASQVLIMAASKCLCCGKPLHPGPRRVWTIFAFITCWLTFFIAVACLLAASVQNAYRTDEMTTGPNPPNCYRVRRGIFGAGAAFIFFTGILSSWFYVNYSNADHDIPPPSRDSGIRMGSM